MREYENGYYWVSYRGMRPIIFEKDNTGWNTIGTSNDPDMYDYEVLGKVSEWCCDD